MKLIYDWRLILKKAWSVRLMVTAAILSGIEVILPFFSTAVEPGVFAALSFLAVSSAFIARIVAQRGIQDA